MLYGETADTITGVTLVKTLRDYTDVFRHSVLRRKTGSRDTTSPWAKARVARSKCTLDSFEYGKLLEEGVVPMEFLADSDIHPLYMDAIIFTDQSHMRAVPAGGNGHDGSTSRQQWRVRVEPSTGIPNKRGKIPERKQQIVVKYDSQSMGCYSICMPKNQDPKFLPTFYYTGKKCLPKKTLMQPFVKKINVSARQSVVVGKNTLVNFLICRDLVKKMKNKMMKIFLKTARTLKNYFKFPHIFGTKKCAKNAKSIYL